MRGLVSIARFGALALFISALPVAGVALDATPAAATLGCAASGGNTICTYAYNGTNGSDGSAQTFTVPTGVTALTLDASGAQGGGTGNPTGGPAGGLGGHERSTITVTGGQTFEIRVGGRPGHNLGGFNGGGAAGNALLADVYGGGGASDVRPTGGALLDRIVTAGGGGGEGVTSPAATSLDGGTGGGAAGGTGASCTGGNSAACGGGGTDVGGGAAGGPPSSFCNPDFAPTAGQLGLGGTGDSCTVNAVGSETAAGAGGGGGWYGGGGGADAVTFVPPLSLALFAGSGGGGSGHVASGTNQVHESGVRSGSGLVTISYAGTPPKPGPAQGTINCTVTGTITFKKPLTGAPSTKTVTMTTALAGTCDNSHVSGGKAPITDVSSKETDYFPAGATCASTLPTAKPGKVQVKWQGRKAVTNKLFTVASNTVPDTNVVMSTAAAAAASQTVPIAKPKNAPFFGKTIQTTLQITDNPSDITTACRFSLTGLMVLHVTGAIVVS